MGIILLLVLAYIIIVSYYEFVKHVLQFESCLFLNVLFSQCVVWLKNYGQLKLIFKSTTNFSLKKNLAYAS